ncbi:hypothetical protein [Maridesulfovibrio salexigens]|uniref:Uncharacterized protein n=1 Tax=Maridesulfovibrio salexigens (strain ATCC 14822 / DSM 2638 / NCIMB 8403 / VKM B-1763) TaxID=526222 RepID=C6BRQ1_MARSD|nr:hypothetical protein [Maridesulfovibrio salexigens]ACS79491.1 hypothetical protein Desal_1429 [Maridesulfovibrio salexigens DSM 2638]
MAKDVSKDQKKSKMFESKYDANILRNLIKEGKNADEVQDALGLASRQSLKQHILRLINEDGKFYEVAGLYRDAKKNPMINFKGDIRITKRQLSFEGSTYKHNDQFEISADNEKIVLTRIVSKSGDVEGQSVDELAAKTDGKIDVKGSTK